VHTLFLALSLGKLFKIPPQAAQVTRAAPSFCL
jgi:hypothetical protein